MPEQTGLNRVHETLEYPYGIRRGHDDVADPRPHLVANLGPEPPHPDRLVSGADPGPVAQGHVPRCGDIGFGALLHVDVSGATFSPKHLDPGGELGMIS